MNPDAKAVLTEEHQKFIKARAQLIFEKTRQADLLIGSLPTHFDPELKQLETIKELEEENRRVGKELEEATRLAGEWQGKVSQRIKLVAKAAAAVRIPTV
mmetsp:Transcript_4068/g.5845  ORF Transcript_4068/g.5845 Transcript_4068/m.5845 type:complete len:100 (-) Transcript_4068:155-454(-)